MPKLFYDIIPPKKIERFAKPKPGFNVWGDFFVKIVALALIIGLNWTGLSTVIQTLAFFSNMENSSGNIFEAGLLDFELQSLSDFPEVCSGEPTERTIGLVNYGNPFKYEAYTSEFSGEVCDYVNLEASLDNELKYNGPLEGFNSDIFEFSDPDDWMFKATFNSDLPASLLGQTCTFKFIFDGSQTKNDLPFGEGFSDIEEITSNILAKACCWTEIRSCGYWKTHSNIYQPHLPQTLGGYPTDEIVNTVYKAQNILIAACGECGCGCDNSMRAKLKGQLLTMKFNIAHFGIGEYIDASTTPKTLNQVVADADNLLRLNPPPSDSVLEEMKDLLEHLNNLGQIPFCSETPPDECKLQLTKTAGVTEVGRGENITYHLTFDNVGGAVCTGGGVKLRDTFNSSLLQYISYTSTRNPNYFSKGTGYVEWNFGNIYPNDPLIGIDLIMKVSGSAQCDSTITNSATYWSNETNWGTPVTADSLVVCGAAPQTGVVINEFLPNPYGFDNAPKPYGEWVELYNTGGSEIDVAGWVLYDEYNEHALPITTVNTNTGSTVVGPGGFLVVYRNRDTDFALDNTGGDSVRLYDGKIKDDANLIDSYTYTSEAHEGKSFARVPDGSDTWVDPIPTPGEPNIMNDEESIFGEALAEEGEDGYEETITPEEPAAPEESATPTPVEEQELSTGQAEEIIVPTEEILDSGGETPAVDESILTTDENQPDEGIISEANEIIDAVVDGIVEEITPDPPADEPAGEEPIEVQSEPEFVIEEAQTVEQAPVEEIATEQTPVIEQQPVILPENTPAIDNSGTGNSGDGAAEPPATPPAGE